MPTRTPAESTHHDARTTRPNQTMSRESPLPSTTTPAVAGVATPRLRRGRKRNSGTAATIEIAVPTSARPGSSPRSLANPTPTRTRNEASPIRPARRARADGPGKASGLASTATILRWPPSTDGRVRKGRLPPEAQQRRAQSRKKACADRETGDDEKRAGRGAGTEP